MTWDFALLLSTYIIFRNMWRWLSHSSCWPNEKYEKKKECKVTHRECEMAFRIKCFWKWGDWNDLHRGLFTVQVNAIVCWALFWVHYFWLCIQFMRAPHTQKSTVLTLWRGVCSYFLGHPRASQRGLHIVLILVSCGLSSVRYASTLKYISCCCCEIAFCDWNLIRKTHTQTFYYSGTIFYKPVQSADTMK